MNTNRFHVELQLPSKMPGENLNHHTMSPSSRAIFKIGDEWSEKEPDGEQEHQYSLDITLFASTGTA
jgi:hypothetical protein